MSKGRRWSSMVGIRAAIDQVTAAPGPVAGCEAEGCEASRIAGWTYADLTNASSVGWRDLCPAAARLHRGDMMMLAGVEGILEVL